MGSKTYVDSVVYNLAGDADMIPDFTRATIVSGQMAGHHVYVGENLFDGYMNGPGMRMRKFMRWALHRRYTPEWIIGVPQDSLIRQDSISDPAVLPALRTYTGRTAGYFGLYHYTTSTDYVLSEAYMQFYADHPGDYEYGNWYTTTIDDDTVSFTVMSNTPDEWDEYYELYNVSYTIPDTHEGAEYRWFHVFLHPDQGRSVSYVYRVGSGYPDLELDFTAEAQGNDYFPMIPLRLNNVMVDDPGNAWMRDTLYPQVQKGYKKAFGQDVEEILETIKDNPNLGDIDYAFTIFAAPLDSPMAASRDFLFEFAKDLFFRWQEAMNRKSIYVYSPSYMFDPGSTSTQRRAMQVGMHWDGMARETGVGLAWPGAQSGQSQVYSGYNTRGLHATSAWPYNSTHCYFIKQTSATTWERIRIDNFRHTTHVYNGVNVELTCADVFNEPEVDSVSGFLVPVSYQVLRDLSLKESTQLALECNHIVFNCYVVKKKKWYQKGIFKVILAVIVIAVTFLTGGFGATSAGLLGTNIAVGTAIGLTGMAAIVAGAMLNMLAAMVVGRLMSAALVEIVGAKWAAIIEMVAAIATLSVQGARNIGDIVQKLTDPKFLLRVTNSVTSAAAQFVQAETLEILQKQEAYLEEYKEAAEYVKKLQKDVLGVGPRVYDPMGFVNVGTPYSPESLDSFLSRTLMTGGDVADISLGIVANFASATLDLKLP